MLSNIKKQFLLSLLTPQGPAKALNLIRHRLTFPRSRQVLGGGINVIHRCNLDCSFCSYGFDDHQPPFADMDQATFTRCLNLPVFRHAFYLVLGGGEPLLHPLVFDFLQQMRARGVLSLIPTNGTLLLSKLDRLLATPPDIVWVSLYDRFEAKQLAALTALAQAKPPGMVLGAAKLITKENLHDMPRTMDLAAQAGARNIFFQQLMIKPNDPEGLKKIIFDTDIEALAVIDQARQYQRRHHPRLNCYFPHPIPTGGRRFFCLSMYKGFQVDPNGAIQPCCVLYTAGKATYGNIFEDPQAHLRHPAYLALKQAFVSARKKEDLPPVCRNCAVLNLPV